MLFCAYTLSSTDVLLHDDVAWASDQVTITANASPRPSVIVRPRVPRSGARLRCSPGAWSGSPALYQYRWVVVHATGVAGRRASLAVTRRLRGHAVECSVAVHRALNPRDGACR